jgi:hypoxanthine phosphoribosyltransferase
MNTLRIHDKNFKPYISEEAIQEKVSGLAENLNRDYPDKKPIFIAILNGAFIFAADLFKSLHIDAEISFIKLASYKGMKSSGQILTAIGLDIDLFDRHVVILEDIVDTGKTLHEFLPQLWHHNQLQLKLLRCFISRKPGCSRSKWIIQDLKFLINLWWDMDWITTDWVEIRRRFISLLTKKRLVYNR